MSELNIQINKNGEDISSLINKLKQYENEIDNLKSKLKNCEQNICELTNKLNNNTKKSELTPENRCKARVWNHGKENALTQCCRKKINDTDYCTIHNKVVHTCKKNPVCLNDGTCSHKHAWEHFGNIDQDIIDICPEYNIGYNLLIEFNKQKEKKGTLYEIEKETLSNGEKNPNVQNITEQFRKIPDNYKINKKKKINNYLDSSKTSETSDSDNSDDESEDNEEFIYYLNDDKLIDYLTDYKCKIH